MKRFILPAVAAISATPAFAHGGMHLHPHGFETALAVGIAVAVFATLYGVYKSR